MYTEETFLGYVYNQKTQSYFEVYIINNCLFYNECEAFEVDDEKLFFADLFHDDVFGETAVTLCDIDEL